MTTARNATWTAQKPLYGLMAEFDDATTLVDGRRADARRGLPEGRRLLARSDPRAVRRAATLKDNAAAAARPARRHRRVLRRFRALLLGLGDRVSAEHRRPPVQQLAVVHPGDLRGHDPARVAHVRSIGHDPAERAADAVSPGVQREAVRRSMRARTACSSRSKPTIRSSTVRRRARSSRIWEREKSMTSNRKTPQSSWLSGVCAPGRGRGLPAGHAQPAEVPAAPAEHAVRRRLERAPAGRGHRRARHAEGRRSAVHRQGRGAPR